MGGTVVISILGASLIGEKFFFQSGEAELNQRVSGPYLVQSVKRHERRMFFNSMKLSFNSLWSRLFQWQHRQHAPFRCLGLLNSEKAGPSHILKSELTPVDLEEADGAISTFDGETT